MKLQAQDLRAAFDVCDAVPSDGVLEASQFVRIAQDSKELTLTLTGTIWAEGWATGDGTGKWTAYVDRRIFKAFLVAANAEVSMILKDQQLTLKSGNRVELALHADINGYENWKPANKYDVSADLKRILDMYASYLPTAAGTEAIRAVNLRTDCVIATNALSMLGVLGMTFPNNVLVPPEVVKFLAKNGGKLATDKGGVGVALDQGYVYQPTSSTLLKFPTADCQKQLTEAGKLPTMIVVGVQGLLDAVKTATRFLMGSETSFVVSQEKGLRITVPLDTGSFERSVPATIKTALPEVKWAIRKALPWLEFVATLDEEAKIELAKTKSALVFRFSHQKKQYIFLSADIK